MSLDTDIAKLTGTASELIDTFTQKESGIEQRVIEALKAVPTMDKEFHIHQLDGDDTNDGSAEAPLKSLQEAFNRCPFGSRLVIFLLDDYVTNTIETINGLNVTIRTSGETPFRFQFGAYKTETNYIRAHLLSTDNGATIHFHKVTLAMPNIGSLGGEVNQFSGMCIGPRYSLSSAQNTFKISYATIDCPAQTLPLIDVYSAWMGLVLHNVTYTAGSSANMAGKWLYGVAAGTPVSDVNYLVAQGINTL